MLRPNKNSYKKFNNKRKLLRLKNSPPPPIETFLMVRPLCKSEKLQIQNIGLGGGVSLFNSNQ